jgi:plasmid stabilization system protein ParE
MVELVWTKSALKDLDCIAEYIAAGSPVYAPVFVGKIVESVELVRDFPYMGRSVPEFEDEALREIIFQNYRVIYKIKYDRIGILAVWHSSMDLDHGKDEKTWDFT